MNVFEQITSNQTVALETLAAPALQPKGTALRQLQHLLQRFDPISLAEMSGVTLLRRTDTKFIMSEDHLYLALERLATYFRVLEIRGRRLHRYQTLYFDTPDLALYRQHHDGLRSRYKVRFRTYVDSRRSFLEVKHKTNRNVTIKNRLETAGVATEVAPYANGFLHAHFPYPASGLRPSLGNAFRRITLVSKHCAERVTLDVGVRAWCKYGESILDGVAIAEVKQEGFSANSAFFRQMRALGIRPTGFSKYCTGISLLVDDVKRNRFKQRLRHVERLMQGKEQQWTT